MFKRYLQYYCSNKKILNRKGDAKHVLHLLGLKNHLIIF